MILSPFTPLFFPSAKADGIESTYMQIFSIKDEILVEIFSLPSETIVFKLFSEPMHTEMTLPDVSSYNLENDLKLYLYRLKLDTGYYSVSFDGKNSMPFMVTDDDLLLQDTVLIQYSPADNKTRSDVAATVGDSRLFFSFRVPGGFKDNGWSFSIDNEQFVCPDGDIIELYGRESIQKVLTIGNSSGVPIWFGQMINRILTCKYVFIDGSRFVRYESSVPEKEQVLESHNSFIFSQKVQQVNYLNPTIDTLL